MKQSAISRIVLAAGIAFGLLSLFQNCSQVNFGVGDPKALVQGGITSSNIPDPAASPTNSDKGVCVLTCDAPPVAAQQNAAIMCQSKAPVAACAAEQDEYGNSVTPVVQSLAASSSHPKTACMSKSACDMIASHLASGKLVLMKIESNQVSTLKGTRFEAVSNPDDCEDTLSDEDVEAQVSI